MVLSVQNMISTLTIIKPCLSKTCSVVLLYAPLLSTLMSSRGQQVHGLPASRKHLVWTSWPFRWCVQQHLYHTHAKPYTSIARRQGATRDFRIRQANENTAFIVTGFSPLSPGCLILSSSVSPADWISSITAASVDVERIYKWIRLYRGKRKTDF